MVKLGNLIGRKIFCSCCGSCRRACVARCTHLTSRSTPALDATAPSLQFLQSPAVACDDFIHPVNNTCRRPALGYESCLAISWRMPHTWPSLSPMLPELAPSSYFRYRISSMSHMMSEADPAALSSFLPMPLAEHGRSLEHLARATPNIQFTLFRRLHIQHYHRMLHASEVVRSFRTRVQALSLHR